MCIFQYILVSIKKKKERKKQLISTDLCILRIVFWTQKWQQDTERLRPALIKAPVTSLKPLIFFSFSYSCGSRIPSSCTKRHFPAIDFHTRLTGPCKSPRTNNFIHRKMERPDEDHSTGKNKMMESVGKWQWNRTSGLSREMERRIEMCNMKWTL